GLSAHTKLAGAGAGLLIVSGIARIVAGVFPLDPCGAPIVPSFSHRMHNAAGAGDVLWVGAAVLIWCSLATFVAAITLPWLLIRLGTDPANVGLFQRASFGILNLWLFVFALVLWSRLSWSDSSASF